MQDRERWDRYLEIGLAALIFGTIASGALLFGGVQQTGVLVMSGFCVASMFIWLIRTWISKSPKILWPPCSWLVLAFVAYAWWSLPVALVQYPARDELHKINLYACLFFLALNNLYRQEITQWFVYALLSLGMLLSCYAVFQFVTNSPYVWGAIKPAMFMHRGSATYICPNHFAGLLELLLPLGIATTFLSRIKQEIRVVVGYASLVILIGIGVSVSRGAWLSCGLALGLMFIWFARKPQLRIPAIVAMLLILMGVGYGMERAHMIRKRFDQMVSKGTPDDVSSRILIWNSAIDLWKTEKIRGLGPSQFDAHFVTKRPAELQWRPANVHNDYLNALVDYGVIGAGIISIFFLTLAVGTIKIWKYVDRASNDLEIKSSNRSAFVMGCVIGIVALLFHSLIDFNFYIPANAALAVTLFGLLSSHLRFATDRYWISLQSLGRIVTSIIILSSIGILLSQMLVQNQERHWLKLARLAKDDKTRLLSYKSAHIAQPLNSETCYSVGEMIRLMAWETSGENRKTVTNAIPYFEKAISLNPFDTYSRVKLGMSYHLLEQTAEAEKYFLKAHEIDPNNAFLTSFVGWHYYDRKQFGLAKEWFEKSLELKNWENKMATYYLRDIQSRVAE